jgi:DNA-binding NarL/FixJ family response regulator
MSGAKTINFLIVDAHPLFIRGLASLIESSHGYKVVAEASTPADAEALALKEKPDIAIVELNMGNEGSMDLIPRLKAQNPDIAILILSMYDERYYAERVLRLGARGYIMKTEPADKVLDAIRTIASGEVYLSDAERERMAKATPGETIAVRKLSDRELQIFSCLGKGLGTIEIAQKFNLSAKTIDTHKEHIKLKLRCNSSRELRRLAIEWSNHPGDP